MSGFKSSGTVDVGIGKSFAKNSWRVNLAMTDVFATTRWDSYSSFDGLQLQNWGRGESRQVKLNVSYGFGRKKSTSYSSAFSELNRL